MILKRKPAFEKVHAEFGSSFSVKHFTQTTKPSKTPKWHFHPEIELAYIKDGCGIRHIGNHHSYFHSGDLVLIGSMLPHSGYSESLGPDESETIIHFHENFLGNDFFGASEMEHIKRLLERSKSGLAFYGETKKVIGSKLEQMVGLDGFGKLMVLFGLLQYMARTDEYVILNAESYTFEVRKTDSDRINKIYAYVQNNFKHPISLEEIASKVQMTVPSFCRYFKRISGKKFTQFVNEIRIVHACKLLDESDENISSISFESGFNNFSYFNRQFKSITGESPSSYRKKIVRVIK